MKLNAGRWHRDAHKPAPHALRMEDASQFFLAIAHHVPEKGVRIGGPNDRLWIGWKRRQRCLDQERASSAKIDVGIVAAI
jgi:hypothetical protein